MALAGFGAAPQKACAAAHKRERAAIAANQASYANPVPACKAGKQAIVALRPAGQNTSISPRSMTHFPREVKRHGAFVAGWRNGNVHGWPALIRQSPRRVIFGRGTVSNFATGNRRSHRNVGSASFGNGTSSPSQPPPWNGVSAYAKPAAIAARIAAAARLTARLRSVRCGAAFLGRRPKPRKGHWPLTPYDSFPSIPSSDSSHSILPTETPAATAAPVHPPSAPSASHSPATAPGSRTSSPSPAP